MSVAYLLYNLRQEFSAWIHLGLQSECHILFLRVTVILSLSSDPSSRKIVSRAYILYCFKVGIQNLDCGYMLGCQSVLVGVTLNLTSGTSPILLAVGIPNLVCGYILGCRVSHTVYSSLCLIYEILLSLGVFYHFVTQFMILPISTLKQCNSKVSL